jgi:hypothetical protein
MTGRFIDSPHVGVQNEGDTFPRSPGTIGRYSELALAATFARRGVVLIA